MGFRIEKDNNPSEVVIPILREFVKALQPKPVTNLTRVGSHHDGGYVVPSNLGDVTKLFSPGCDGVVSFEKDLYKKYKIPSVVLDEIIKKPSNLEPFIEFQANWLDSVTSDKTISLVDWVDQNSKPSELLMLQMDIEGAEYEVLRTTPSETLAKFHTIIVEFHYFEMIKNSFLFETKIKPAFDKLLQNHIPVFLNPNNCCGEVRFGQFSFPRVFEMTLINRKYASSLQSPIENQIQIYANIPNLPPIKINWELF
jgi:hypothetical protein